MTYPDLAGMPSTSPGRCQAARDGWSATVGPDTPRFWKSYDHCDEPVTHRLTAGCVHEHVQSWEICAGCAAVLQGRLDGGEPRYCTGCQPDHLRCLIAVVIRPIPAAAAA
jgi:hypothetical protein